MTEIEDWNRQGSIAETLDALRAEVERLRADCDFMAQVMWDARAELGFDNDGDETPAASIAGAVSVFPQAHAKSGHQAFALWFLENVRDARRDHDEALDEGAAAEARLRKVDLVLADHAECEDADPYACTIIGDLRDALAAEPAEAVRDES